MPQGNRRTPFSGKKKKEQLAAKRQVRKIFPRSTRHTSESNDEAHLDNAVGATVQKINYESRSKRDGGRGGQANRYALQFYKETEQQLRALKEECHRPLNHLTQKDLETGEDFFIGYDFPLRPKWSYRLNKDELERNENRYFTEYLMNLERIHTEVNKMLSHFELNLETWRQLWRVIEMCDVLLIIVDIRTPTLMFPPALYDHVTHVLHKNIILVLNKIDLVPAPVVVAWKHYFEGKYKNVQICMFTSFPEYNLRKLKTTERGLNIRRRRGKMRMTVEGAQQVYAACTKIVQNAVDLTSWARKIQDEAKALDDDEDDKQQNATNESGDDDDDDDDDGVKYERTHVEDESNINYEEHELYKNGVLTIGCVGFPNVGKSSLLNGLMGRKVVSVSRTPGHTKHFQTIFLTNTVRLCDCPGLVFPSSTPRTMQSLLGSYPIAQLRVPIACVRFLAERVDLVRVLSLQHPDEDAKPNASWSAFEVCEAWALKRGFLTPKAARPDTSRAANNILRMALDGQITMCLLPPGYSKDELKWKEHSDIEEVQQIQALGKIDDSNAEIVPASELDDDDDEDDDDDDDEEISIPQVRNAFELLNTD